MYFEFDLQNVEIEVFSDHVRISTFHELTRQLLGEVIVATIDLDYHDRNFIKGS